MKPGLTTAHACELTWIVRPEHTIHLGFGQGTGGAVVFATPAMVSLMEHAARDALLPFLEEGEESVGAQISVEHLAATPIAATVRARAEVTAIDGRLVDFQIAAFDEVEQIGRATHRRAVIRIDRFAGRLAEKVSKLSSGILLPMQIKPNTGERPPLETLLVTIDGPVATVTINRPRQLNAVSGRMTADLEQLSAWLAGHGDSIRVAILTGAGEAFCAGDDVKELAGLSPPEARELSLRQARMFLSWEQLPQVLIAAVNGFALGAGCVCAYSCDFRIAAHGARFAMPEILLGWAPGYGVAQLTALVGKARALELCLTGKQITAQQALEHGLVTEIVPHARLLPAARELAAELLKLPALALRETKWRVHGDEPISNKIAYLADTAAYLRCLATPDAREGIAAFREKRAATFGS